MTGIALTVEGTGPAVLLLHAFPLHAGMWRSQSELTSKCTLLMPDLPGFGRSRAAAPITSLSELVRSVHNAALQRGVERAVVAGCSMGGYLAFALLRAQPQFVAGLALIDTRAAADSAAVRERRLQMIERVQREGAEFLQDEWPQSALSPATLQRKPEMVAAVRSMCASATAAGVCAAQQLMADRPDSIADLSSIRVPAVVIHGLDDPVVPVAEAQAMAAAIAGAQFIAVPQAGHLPNIEQPQLVTDALRSLVAR